MNRRRHLPRIAYALVVFAGIAVTDAAAANVYESDAIATAFGLVIILAVLYFAVAIPVAVVSTIRKRIPH